MRNLSVAVSLLLGIACSCLACGNASEPLPEPVITLELLVEPESEGRVKAHAVVTNAGSLPVYYYYGCGCGVYIGVHDAEGTPLRLSCGPDPLCPCDEVELPPGKTLEASLEFRGETCVGEAFGELKPVPPGEYEIVASFSYSRVKWPNPREYSDLHESYSFVWK